MARRSQDPQDCQKGADGFSQTLFPNRTSSPVSILSRALPCQDGRQEPRDRSHGQSGCAKRPDFRSVVATEEGRLPAAVGSHREAELFAVEKLVVPEQVVRIAGGKLNPSTSKMSAGP